MCLEDFFPPSTSPLPPLSLFPDLPEHTVVKLPALSPTMELGTIVSWEKKEGDEIAEGDTLAQVETDKATMDMEWASAGYLAKILIPEGTKDIPLGKVSVCVCVCVCVCVNLECFPTITIKGSEPEPTNIELDPPPPPTGLKNTIKMCSGTAGIFGQMPPPPPPKETLILYLDCICTCI